VNQALPFLNGWSLEIKLTVSKKINMDCFQEENNKLTYAIAWLSIGRICRGSFR